MNLIEVCDIIPKEEIAGLIAEYVEEDARNGDFFYNCLFDENVDNTSKIKNINEEDIYQYIAYWIDYRIEDDIMSTYEDELYSQSVYLDYDDIKKVMQTFIKKIFFIMCRSRRINITMNISMTIVFNQQLRLRRN